MIMKCVKNIWAYLAAFFLCIFLTGCSLSGIFDVTDTNNVITLESVPAFSGEPYVELNQNEPEFEKGDGSGDSFETYSPLDSLGRCGVAYANIGEDLMPTEKRGNIGNVKPSGWNSVQYKNVQGRFLYNRCHLIGFQLTGENANPENLITGTRYMNTEGMLPFENMVADYIKETGNHVLYRVTPVFEGDHLVASGVQMEARSVEDEGEGICFNVFVYNCQPGIEINYADGTSCLSEEALEEKTDSGQKDSLKASSVEKNTAGQKEKKQKYVINKNTKKFHEPSCASAADTDDENKEIVKSTRSELIADGLEPCGRCKP